MAKKKARSRAPGRKGREPESERPSMFFIVALAAGLILLVWLAIRGALMRDDLEVPPLESPPAQSETTPAAP